MIEIKKDNQELSIYRDNTLIEIKQGDDIEINDNIKIKDSGQNRILIKEIDTELIDIIVNNSNPVINE